MSGADMNAKKTILVLNSGSSSLKFGVFQCGAEDEEALFNGSAEGIGRNEGSLSLKSADGKTLYEQDHVLESQQEALKTIAGVLEKHLDEPVGAVGHRVVHGGPKLREHQLITPEVLEQLAAAEHFAPLHVSQALKLIKEAQEIFKDCPHYACFDDAFHRTMPEVASHLPLPQKYFMQGVMRYGFHGLSYESLVYRLGGSIPQRAVFAHLGSGSSVCAVREGKSIDTSMGLTPTGGLPMATRSGDLDPGVLLYLMRAEKMDADALEELLNHACGLKGLSDGESDMQALLKRDDAAAKFAVDAFATAVRKYVGAYAALMGGVDLLVFTGGIGEHSEVIRAKVCESLAFVGLGLGSSKVQVMKAEEELQMARHCRALMAHT
ncbi:acetate/propionate family kinase [Granulicella paludicola]|uniref:acetate/propionate family kinase n=1 Tax=Granulicella paludicola TaxID=474951 RepID=UPI0021DF428C|nr:acetate/propionate family kinase [Granulicella paludicola]